MIWRNCKTENQAENFPSGVSLNSDSYLVVFILNHCFQCILKAIIFTGLLFFICKKGLNIHCAY